MSARIFSACALVALFYGCAGCSSSHTPVAGEVRITTEPSGATIFVNGEQRSTSPLTLVQLPEGRYRIEAVLSGHRTTRQSLSVLAGQNTSTHLDLEALEGLLLLTSMPSEAEVLSEGTFLGTTPLLLHDLSLGTHRFTLRKSGFLERTVNVDIENRIPRSSQVDLPSDSGILQMTSKPGNAVVFINGVQRGTTPVRIEGVPTGGAELEIQLPGYKTYTESVRLYPGQEISLNANLTPEPGTLTVLSEPEGARVYLDNALRGRTPFTANRLQAGRYRIRVDLEGYDSEARSADIVATDSTTLEFRLVKNSGELLLVTEPPNVKVFINGRYKGTTDASTAGAVSEALSLDLLPEGRHTLELVRRGFFDLEKQIDIRAGEVVSLHETLRRRFIPDTAVRSKDRPGSPLTGVLVKRHENGDVELEVSRGVIVLIPGDEIEQVSPILDQ